MAHKPKAMGRVKAAFQHAVKEISLYNKKRTYSGKRYRCVRGHDLCETMYPGPDCPYCEHGGKRRK